MTAGGKATLDGTGEAMVELPHYFAKINKDPRYTLTAVGAPMPMLHVAEEIDESTLSVGAKAEPGTSRRCARFASLVAYPAAKFRGRSRPSAATAGFNGAAHPSKSTSKAGSTARTSTPNSTASRRKWA